MNTPSTGTNRIWPNWWRFGGVDGLIFAVLFIIGALVLQGDTPMHGDSAEDIRKFFVDDGKQYLVGDFLAGIAFVIFFIPYLIAFRWVLGSAEGSPPIWSWMTFAGGILTTTVAAGVGFGWSALALGLEDNPQLDDATLRLLVDMNAVGFAGVMITLALFVGSAGFVIFRTGVLWRWLGIVGLVAAILLLIGAAWPIEGDDEGALAIGYFIGLPLTLLFVIISSVGMIMMKEEPNPVS